MSNSYIVFCYHCMFIWTFIMDVRKKPVRSNHGDNNSRISLAAEHHRVFPDAYGLRSRRLAGTGLWVRSMAIIGRWIYGRSCVRLFGENSWTRCRFRKRWTRANNGRCIGPGVSHDNILTFSRRRIERRGIGIGGEKNREEEREKEENGFPRVSRPEPVQARAAEHHTRILYTGVTPTLRLV